MNNHQQSNQNEQPQNIEVGGQAAQLAVIAGMITTFGDGLATIAAILALQEAEQARMNNNNNNNNNNADIKNMQKQIDDLTLELKQIKQLLRKGK